MSEELNINDLIEDYNKYLDRIQDGCKMLINELRNENTTVISKELLNFLEGIDWMTKVKSYLASLGINIVLDEEKLYSLLDEVNSSLESKDFHTISDIFEYEIIEFFKEAPQIHC